MKLDREQVAAAKSQIEHVAPLGGRGALGPAQTLDERLVVRDGDGHIDQSVTKSWDHRDVARRDGGVQLECQLVPRVASLRSGKCTAWLLWYRKPSSRRTSSVAWL